MQIQTESYSVWVGGTEVNDYLLAKSKYRFAHTEHFLEKLRLRAFDLGVLLPAYNYVEQNSSTIKRGSPFEISIGHATIVCALDRFNTIHLITGWVGNRRKK